MQTARSIFMATMLVAGVFAVPNPATATAAATWSVMPSESPAGGANTTLAAAACPSVTSCFAVGSAQFTSFVEHWDGTKWSTVSVPQPNAEFSSLTDIACARAPPVVSRWAARSAGRSSSIGTARPGPSFGAPPPTPARNSFHRVYE